MQMKELAAELGVSYGYISQLRNGIKPISGLSESIVDAAAKFLGLPRIAVMIAADIVKPTDFYSETMDMEGLVDASLKVIQSDPEWGPRMDPEITRGNLRSKLFVVNLYEEATGSRLLMHRANVKKYIEIMQQEFADD
jgi:transcriptional regulator with XRE-family HTH domain